MRKFVLVVVLLLLLSVSAAAAARPVDKNDGTFAIKNAVGQITLTTKGSVLGRVDEGQIAIDDMSPGGGEIQVQGWERKWTKGGTAFYKGGNIRFRIIGGWYSLTVTGIGVNLSAVGRGTVQGQGISEGLFSTDGSPFKAAPAVQYAGSFGQQ
jgi:opacity protein-like surface antigen